MPYQTRILCFEKNMCFVSFPWIISYYEFPTLILLYNKLLNYSQSREQKTLGENYILVRKATCRKINMYFDHENLYSLQPSNKNKFLQNLVYYNILNYFLNH